jgi:hypothetical protein
MIHNASTTIREAVRLVLTVVVTLIFPAIGITQTLENCFPPKPLKTNNGIRNQGTIPGTQYTVSFDGDLSTLPAHYVSAIVTAMANWNYVNTGRSGVTYTIAQGNPNATIKIRLAPAVAYGAMVCDNPSSNNRCGGTTQNSVDQSTGNIDSSLIHLAGNGPNVGYMIEEHALYVMLHELGHAQGLGDIYDAEGNGKTVMFAGYNLSAPTECDGLMVKRLASARRLGAQADPCRGIGCLASIGLTCLWGNGARNAGCFPPWLTEPLKGDVRWRIGPGNWNPFANVASPPSVPNTGSIGLSTIDPDGQVMRVDWYVFGQPVYTAFEDPWVLPQRGARDLHNSCLRLGRSRGDGLQRASSDHGAIGWRHWWRWWRAGVAAILPLTLVPRDGTIRRGTGRSTGGESGRAVAYGAATGWWQICVEGTV